MTQRVVDPLEAVEIDEQQCQAALLARRLGERIAEQLGKQVAVRQSAEAVEVSQFADPVLGRHALGDVEQRAA